MENKNIHFSHIDLHASVGPVSAGYGINVYYTLRSHGTNTTITMDKPVNLVKRNVP